MKKLLMMLIVPCVSVLTTSVRSQDRPAEKLADRLATAFSLGRMSRLDNEHLLKGRLQLSMQYDITDGDDPEFVSKTFRSFAGLERWLKASENQPGFPIRTSGTKTSCRRGLCRLDLVDGQMAHNHVFLTRVWYGFAHRKRYVTKMRILYG